MLKPIFELKLIRTIC